MNRFFYSFFLILLSYNSLLGQNQEVARIPFILNNDHIIIQLRINDSSPLNFMFDSGAGGILINKLVSDSLGLEAASERTNTGAVGTHTVSILKGNTIFVGDAQINGVNMMRDDNEFEELDSGEEVAGIIGFHILSRFVVRVDYDTHELVLYNRSNYVYKGDGVVVPIVLTYNLPIVVGKIKISEDKETEGFFLADTGARSYLLVSSPTVKKFDMLNEIGDYYTLKTDVGSSGKKAKIIFGKINEFDFAEHKFENLPAVLSQAQEGVLSFDGINGIIGNRILQKFNVTFDYQRNLLYLEPNSNMGKPYKTNVSGFSIAYENGKPFIKDIVDHSPATKAGLRNGDELVAIDGKIIENMTHSEVRAYFQEVDRKLELVIRRSSKLKYTEIRLRELI
ncbi:MAG: aspartyl protease family protein [Cyclobacteriaceae bacterium]|nr:aspartyl protease family protein [Cyclobacteriaceae bacterium]